MKRAIGYGSKDGLCGARCSRLAMAGDAAMSAEEWIALSLLPSVLWVATGPLVMAALGVWCDVFVMGLAPPPWPLGHGITRVTRAVRARRKRRVIRFVRVTPRLMPRAWGFQ